MSEHDHSKCGSAWLKNEQAIKIDKLYDVREYLLDKQTKYIALIHEAMTLISRLETSGSSEESIELRKKVLELLGGK